MVVLFVRDLTGGIRKHIVSILTSYLQNPSDVLVVTNLAVADKPFQIFLEQNPIFKTRLVNANISRAPGPSDIFQLCSLFFKLKKLPKQTVFHGHGSKGGLYSRILGKLFGFSTMYTPHGGSIHQMHGRIQNFIYIWVEKFLYHLTDFFVFESRYSLASFAQNVKKESSQFILNYNGVTFPPHLNESVEKSKFQNPVVIGAFGALRKIKGYDILLRAGQILMKNGIDFRIKIFGSGEELDALLKLSRELGISDKTQIGLETQDALVEMRRCDIVAQPSRFESFGYSTLESISLGVPVVVSQVGGLTEIVEDMVTGLTFPVEDHVSLANALLYLCQNPKERVSFTQNAFIRAQSKFNENVMLAKLRQLYDGEISSLKKSGGIDDTSYNVGR